MNGDKHTANREHLSMQPSMLPLILHHIIQATFDLSNQAAQRARAYESSTLEIYGDVLAQRARADLAAVSRYVGNEVCTRAGVEAIQPTFTTT